MKKKIDPPAYTPNHKPIGLSADPCIETHMFLNEFISLWYFDFFFSSTNRSYKKSTT